MADRGFTWLLPVALLSVILRLSTSMPVMRWTDTAVVESTIRETVARPPSDLLLAATHSATHHSHSGSGKSGGRGKHGKGYHHKASKKGDDGYEKFDSFHKKTGDKYGYEEHSSFGKSKANKKNNKYHDADGAATNTHKDVEFLPGASVRARSGARFQSLQDVSGDAFKQEGVPQRRQLHDDDGDLFFVFPGVSDHYTASENESDGEGAEGEEAAQQQEGHDDNAEHAEDDGSEAQEQQEADDDEESGAQKKKEEEAEDYDY